MKPRNRKINQVRKYKRFTLRVVVLVVKRNAIGAIKKATSRNFVQVNAKIPNVDEVSIEVNIEDISIEAKIIVVNFEVNIVVVVDDTIISAAEMNHIAVDIITTATAAKLNAVTCLILRREETTVQK